MEKILLVLLQLCSFILLAPLVQGVIKKVKARLQNRIGADLFQPYRDILKYLKKDSVISKEASWLTVTTPYLCLGLILLISILIPSFYVPAPLGFSGDIILVIYLLALCRFFMALTALDAGSSFGGFGGSRESVMGALTEPALLLSIIAVLLTTTETNIGNVIQNVLQHDFFISNFSWWLALIAFVIVLIIETGRLPYDNPDTHLELTMMHESMMLEYSGRYLGLIVLFVQIKQLLLITVLINLFFPYGIAVNVGYLEVAGALVLYVSKVFIVGLGLAVIETVYAKIRLFLVPNLILASISLAVLALIFQLFNY